MPRYEYECSGCAARFDMEHPVAEAGTAQACPFCDRPARRVFTAPRILLKADPRDSRPVWHSHGAYGHAHPPGKGFHGRGAEQQPDRDRRGRDG